MVTATFSRNGSHTNVIGGTMSNSGVYGLLSTNNAPTLEMVRVGDLKVDTYQRQKDELSTKHIEKIAAAFDWHMFFVIGVSERDDGSRWVYDGQHRVTAVLQVFGPDQLVPALVSRGLSRSDEAKLFYSPQVNRLPVSPLSRFKAQLERNEPAAKEILAITERNGFSISNASTGGVIKAISALEGCYYPVIANGLDRSQYYDRHPDTYGERVTGGVSPWEGRERLDWVLRQCAIAWRYKEQVNSPVITALRALYVAQSGMRSGIDENRLTETLRSHSPLGWLNRAREKRTPPWILVAEEYNKRLSSANRIPLKALAHIGDQVGDES